MPIVRRWNTKSFTWDNIEQITEVVGIYFLYNSSGSLIYIGSTNNLYVRLLQHKNGGDIPNVLYFSAWQMSSLAEARRREIQLIQSNDPYHNVHHVD